MYIHTVKEGESVYSIAREYGVSPAKIIENNGLESPDRLAVGRELLILIPTRTYTARRGDTLDGIAKRFCVSESELKKNNPALSYKGKIYPEEVFAVKYPAKKHGISLLNGYVYKGTSSERLSAVMPYLSHVTVCSKSYKNGKMRNIFDGTATVKEAKSSGKQVILRIYSDSLPCTSQTENEAFISLAIKEARDSDCDGISINVRDCMEGGGAADFLFNLKKAALAEGLTLFAECGSDISEALGDTADSLIINYDKLLCDSQKSFDDAERSFYTKTAELCDTTSAFADISPFAYCGKKALTIEEAERLADNNGIKTEYDENTMLCSYKSQNGEVIYPSLKNVKARLELLSELGFLGYTIDVMRVPISHLLTFNAMFHVAPDYFSGGI